VILSGPAWITWGWPDELQSWNWDGHEGDTMNVRVFSRYQVIRLQLNDKVIDEQTIGENSRLIANFKVPYESGVLRAIALENGIEVTSKELKTTGAPDKIKLVADRTRIKADRNDLSYIKVAITDAQGHFVPNAAIPVTFTITGVGEIAGSGNACPYDMESFNNAVCKTFHGQALVILRPLKNKEAGEMTLRAEAYGLTAAEINITVQ
jgi:beta-galactosidase